MVLVRTQDNIPTEREKARGQKTTVEPYWLGNTTCAPAALPEAFPRRRH